MDSQVGTKFQFQVGRTIPPGSPEVFHSVGGPELGPSTDSQRDKNTLRVCARRRAIFASRNRNEKIVHLLVPYGWKSRQWWCSPVLGQAKLLLDRAILHSACLSSSSSNTTTLSYFSLNKRESQRECLWKPTSTCSTPWLSIDSAIRRRKESPLTPSSCRTLQCDQNSDTEQCNRTWIEWGSWPAKRLSIWRPRPKQNGAEICIWSICR